MVCHGTAIVVLFCAALALGTRTRHTPFHLAVSCHYSAKLATARHRRFISNTMAVKLRVVHELLLHGASVVVGNVTVDKGGVLAEDLGSELGTSHARV